MFAEDEGHADMSEWRTIEAAAFSSGKGRGVIGPGEEGFFPSLRLTLGLYNCNSTLRLTLNPPMNPLAFSSSSFPLWFPLFLSSFLARDCAIV